LSAVSRANCIQKSNEQQPNTFPESEPALYLGTDRGVYKYKYDFSGTSNWYPVNSGIGTNYEIHDLANYYQIIRSNDYKPDSLVQYALAKDGGGNPYIYISADSGRSWIEFGSYFRDRNIQVNDLVTFSDWRPTADFPLWLAAGTVNGVYRFPFNVKSGTIADNETWGPGTIIVNGDVTVPDGVTLTIEPGTSILILYDFDKLESGISASLSEIIVQGTLLAQGTSSDSIFLMASSVQLGSPQPGDWKGIYIDTTADCTLEYCSISFAENGLESRNNSEVQIEHCNFHDNEFDGVYCYKSYTDIQHSRFGNNGVAESR
jgi:parallel beta-helix repeat protein